jgi:hypothetical protein
VKNIDLLPLWGEMESRLCILPEAAGSRVLVCSKITRVDEVLKLDGPNSFSCSSLLRDKMASGQRAIAIRPATRDGRVYYPLTERT